MAKILVTGIMGTLGRPLKQKLEERGHDVWGADLQHQADQKYYRADVSNYRQLERVFEQDYDYVYPLAAEFGRINAGEYYHNYRSVVCLFTYRALHRLPYDVYLGYHRVFMYIDDFIPTLANVVDNFVPGEVYNIGGDEFRSVKELSDLILNSLKTDDSIVNYLPEDKHNVLNKKPDIEKARKAFGHNPRIILEEGVPKTVRWMKSVYADSISKVHK